MENTTAKVSCFARASHYKNNKNHIFADDHAEKILGSDYDMIAESMAQGINFFMPGFDVCKCLDSTEMTDRYFAEYNKNEQGHQMAAPVGEGMKIAIRDFAKGL